MLIKLLQFFIMKALDDRLLGHAVRNFNMAIGRGVGDFGKAVLGAPLVTKLSDGTTRHVGKIREF